MDASTTKPERTGATTGRVAVPEIAELLHLQRPAAAVAAAVVVLLGLLVALLAPGALPPNALTGFGVGLVALLAAVAAAVVLDGRDPVLRGPRHLRRDGHSVLARMAGPDATEHGGAVLEALERRLAERKHLSIAITGTGTDPSALAVAVGRGAAAAGHTSLVIDLRAAGAPGVADVGAGTVRLGEAAQLAADRPYAWIGAGADRGAAVSAAAGVARRPPRDLELLLVVAPEAATHAPELLQACERTLLLVAADTQQRAMVAARLEALQRAGGRAEAVVVGGLQVADGAIASLGDESSEHERPAAFAPTPFDEPAAAPQPEVEDEAAPDEATPDEFAAAAEELAAQRGEAVESLDDLVSELAEESPAAAPTPAPPPPPPAPPTDRTADEPVVDVTGGDMASDVPPPPNMDDTGPIPPVTFRTTGSSTADVEDFTAPDPLVTTAALDQLLRRHDQQG